MQDRFKFRHWDKRINKMFYPERNDNFGYYVNNSDIIETMQCTGLKDKNGKLIYENDIVTDVLANQFIINFDEKYLAFLLTNIKTKESMVFYPNIKLEIIGNIYENPELLEVENDQ